MPTRYTLSTGSRGKRMGSGRSGRSSTTREMALFAISLTLVALVGISVARSANSLFMAIILSASVATAFSRWLFPGGPFFSLTFANLIAVYTCIFAFFMEEVFGEVRPAVLGIGFSLPILFFLVGCWLRRADITSVVDHPDIRSSQALYGALVWLVPVFLVGAGVFVLSSFAEPVANTNLVFIVAMLAIGLIVLAVSRSVAIFLVDAGLLFDEFFQRMSQAGCTRLCVRDVLFDARHRLCVDLQYHFAVFDRGALPGRERCTDHQLFRSDLLLDRDHKHRRLRRYHSGEQRCPLACLDGGDLWRDAAAIWRLGAARIHPRASS